MDINKTFKKARESDTIWLVTLASAICGILGYLYGAKSETTELTCHIFYAPFVVHDSSAFSELNFSLVDKDGKAKEIEGLVVVQRIAFHNTGNTIIRREDILESLVINYHDQNVIGAKTAFPSQPVIDPSATLNDDGEVVVVWEHLESEQLFYVDVILLVDEDHPSGITLPVIKGFISGQGKPTVDSAMAHSDARMTIWDLVLAELFGCLVFGGLSYLVVRLLMRMLLDPSEPITTKLLHRWCLLSILIGLLVMIGYAFTFEALALNYSWF